MKNEILINGTKLTENEVNFIEIAVLRFENELTGNYRDLDELGEVEIDKNRKISIELTNKGRFKLY